jgi:hypothetical protein
VISLAVFTAIVVSGCSSGTTSGSGSTSTAGASSAAATPSTAPASSAAPALAPWIGDAAARKILPTKDEVTTVVGATVAKDPAIASYKNKDLVITARVNPESCTDVYGLVWALTVPKDTSEMTAAAYAVGNSALVVEIGQSATSMDQLKSAVDACPTFSVIKTHGEATYAVGDSVSEFTITRATLASPTSLSIGATSKAQILLSTDEKCTSGASPGPECVEMRTDLVNQEIRQSATNLISVWGVSTADVNGQKSTDPVIAQNAVTGLADGIAKAVAAADAN